MPVAEDDRHRAAARAATVTDAAGSPAHPDAGGRADVTALLALGEQIQALIEGRLDVAVEAVSLFDIDVGSERVIAVEIERLRRVLREAGTDGGMHAADGGGHREASEGGAGTGSEPSSSRVIEPYPLADPELLAARLAVDRERLAFYEMSQDARKAVLDEHRARQQADDGGVDDRLDEAQRKQRAAAEERESALDAARQARTEAGRRVAEERARLLGIKEQQAKLDAALIEDKRAMDAFAESLLGWLRGPDQLLAAERSARPEPGRIDRLYDQLIESLTATRQGLTQAIAAIDSADGTPPLVGDDPLRELPVEIERRDLDELRAKLTTAERDLLARREQQRWKRTRQLHRAVQALDERRRGLVPLLSREKRNDVLGFGPDGFEQARAETEQVGLVLRYHTQETRRWLSRLGKGHGAGGSALVIAVTLIKWILPLALFIWWRRRADRTLESWARQAREARQQTGRPGRRRLVERAVRFVRQIRVPLEWLLLIGALIALLPSGASGLLEVQLLWTVVGWTLGGLLVVHAINALLARRHPDHGLGVDVAALRLRTLVLLGRVTVVVGLVLSLTNTLVGRGTIYDWVFTTCWWAAAPLGLVIVHWWRPVIFSHVERRREKGRVLEWVDKARDGWGSFFAAAAGMVYLMATSGYRFVRVYVGSVEWVRRGLAYWFRHEVDKKAGQRPASAGDQPLPAELFDALGPDQSTQVFLPSAVDQQLAALVERVRQPGGAVVAVVGERGSGKTTLLERLDTEAPGALRVRCPQSGITAFQVALREALGLAADADRTDVVERLVGATATDAILVDDAHHLVRPVVDGLDEVDRLVSLARASSTWTTWVFAFDRVIWQFFQRAREVRPLFDEVVELPSWPEDALMRLVDDRCRLLDLEPDFSRLAPRLTEDLDSVARAEALKRARAGYGRLLWDYSSGNPAVALHCWRTSLARSAAGQIMVQLFRPPDTGDLTRLPDSTVFVLRAVVQLVEASPGAIAEATMLDADQVANALRYAHARGYLVESEGRYAVPWSWFRAITRFLEGRHLLTRPKP